MANDYFEASLALNPTGGAVPNAIALVYAQTDTAFATPLSITDMTDMPLAQLVASPDGVYPAFKVTSGETHVLAKSGSVVTPITSKLGVMFDIIPDPAEVTTPLTLIAQDSTYQLVPRDEVYGVPPDPTTAPAGAVLTVQNGVMQWAVQSAGIAGAPNTWPNTFPPSGHTHSTGQISDASTVGRAVLSAADAQAARAAIGAGTGNGTSNLTLGSSATTAAPGNHSHTASAVSFVPAGGVTASTVQDAIIQAASMGSGGGATASQVQVIRFASGQYPALPTAKPVGVIMFTFIGPVVPTSGNVSGGIPSYVGNGASQIPAEYRVNAGLT